MHIASALPGRVDMTPAGSHTHIPEPTWTLADTAEAILRATFEGYDHHPSPAHFEALQDILTTVQAMADEAAEPTVHFSPVSPGIGKSQALQAAARALTVLPDYQDIGMVICVERIEEAADYAKAFAANGIGRSVAIMVSRKSAQTLVERSTGGGEPLLPPDTLETVALVTADDNDAAGLATATERQVLIVTKARVALATRMCGFRSVAAFHFRGRPRSVVAWDEAFSYGREVAISAYDLGELPKAVDRASPEFAFYLFEMAARLTQTDHNEVIHLPDWSETFGVTEADVQAALDAARVPETDGRWKTVAELFLISGQSVRVYHQRSADPKARQTMLNYRDTLPADLLPVLVLDASALVRTVYANNVEYRQARKLRAAQQNYANLDVRVWTRGGGKRSFKTHPKELLQGIAEMILEAPEEACLVVHHKGASINLRDVQGRDGFQVALEALLPPHVRPRVRYTTWGAHQASNAYGDIPRVILGGTLFLPDAAYVALTHSSMDLSIADHPFADASEVRKVRDGEYRHALLQAALRGRARKSLGDTCQPCEVTVIASSTSGVPAVIPETFPGCRVSRWRPAGTTPVSKGVAAAIAAMDDLIAEGAFDTPGATVTVGVVCHRMSMLDEKRRVMRPNTFGERIASTEAWRTALVERDLIEVPVPSSRGRPTRGLTMVSGEEPDAADSDTVHGKGASLPCSVSLPAKGHVED